MNIYEIDQAIASLIDEETGEVIDLEAIVNLQMERDRKIENLACAFKNLKADADAIKVEIKNLQERAKTCENKAERAKAYLEKVLAGEKFDSPRCKVTYTKSTETKIGNEEEAYTWLAISGYPDAYKIEHKLDKRVIKDLLKQGIQIPTVELVQKTTMGVK